MPEGLAKPETGDHLLSSYGVTRLKGMDVIKQEINPEGK